MFESVNFQASYEDSRLIPKHLKSIATWHSKNLCGSIKQVSYSVEGHADSGFKFHKNGI